MSVSCLHVGSLVACYWTSAAADQNRYRIDSAWICLVDYHRGEVLMCLSSLQTRLTCSECATEVLRKTHREAFAHVDMKSQKSAVTSSSANFHAYYNACKFIWCIDFSHTHTGPYTPALCADLITGDCLRPAFSVQQSLTAACIDWSFLLKDTV